MDAPRQIELRPHEEVLRVVHTTLIPRFWRWLLLYIWTILPFFFLFPLWREGRWGVIVFLVWLGSGIVLLTRAYLIWVRTVFIVTDQRIIDLDQQGFFVREATEAQHEQIDEVSYHVKGVIPTIFRYGTLSLHLHGSSADIVVSPVKRPVRLAALVNDVRTESKSHT